MRHARFLLAAALLTAAAPALAQPPIAFGDAGLHAIQFVDAKEGWACGDDGTIWHSIDGGKTWERQKTGTRASLRSVHFVTEYTGYAVGRVETPSGSVGVLLKTTDGGIRWQELGTNAMPGLHAVRFLDEKYGFVCGDGSPAFPSGMFFTADGGQTWKPAKGPRLPSGRGAAVTPAKTVVVGGAWGKLGVSDGDAYKESELDPLAGRTVHAVACTAAEGKPQGVCFAVGDGGAVLVSTDGGAKWGHVNLGLAAESLASCDFRCVATRGSHVWVAGRPGSFVLHSPDLGATWEVQKTELTIPVNGIHFLDDKIGWMVGDFGSVLGTTDGGKTWTVLKLGGQRAAALFLHAAGQNTPLDVVALLGGADGYLCAATGLMTADPATADPRHASDAERLRYAMRLSGGASGETSWMFPLSAHAAGLPPRELLASWDRAHAGKANDQLLRQAVLAIRIWQPEVIVCDTIAADTPPAEALVLNAAKKAFELAADPKAYPEQLTTLNLRAWAPKKMYALSRDPKAAPVKLDQTVFNSKLSEAPTEFAETAGYLLASPGANAENRSLVLVTHRLQGSETHAALFDGVFLAHGGPARRAAVAPGALDPNAAAEKQKAVQLRRNLERLAAMTDTELGGAQKVLAQLGPDLKKMPDDVAARTAFAIASRMAARGQWDEAREVFGVLATNYPGHPLAIEAFRWLVRYHASTELRRRNEIQMKLSLKAMSYDAPGGIKPAGGAPTVIEDQYKFHSQNMIMQWHTTCLALEPKLSAFGAVHSRDPAAWLCFLAARRQTGRHNDADKFVADYFKHAPGAVTAAAGADLWRDCLAAELWLTNPGAMPALPKPLAYAKTTAERPLLDGKLDDACWKEAKTLSLNVTAAASDKPDEAKAFGTQYKTEALFAYDDRFIYVALKCDYPTGKKVEPVAKRTRDADLNGHDRIDILLDLDRDYQTYYRFQIDSRGCLAEDCCGDRTWNPKYFVAFHSTDTGWTAEYAIPVVELTGERPSHGKTWALNVSRVVPGLGVQAWSGPADQTPRPEGMGLLQFRADR